MRAKIWMLPLALLLAQGCDDVLTEVPEDFLTLNNFYRTESDAVAAVAAIYEPLVDVAAFRGRTWYGMELSSDQSMAGASDPGPSHHGSGQLAFDPTNRNLTDGWRQFYKAIGRANVAMDRIAEIKMNEGRRATLVGEAKFLRGWLYFYLVRLYGDVPLVTSSKDLSADKARASREEVYQQIIADAQEAAQALPLQWSGTSVGRPTRGGALALLADAHLTRGEWQKAADYAKQVIDAGVYRLYPNYLHAFLPAYENGPEHLFSLQANGPVTPNGSRFVDGYYPRVVGRGLGGGWGTVQPTRWQYESYLPGDYRKEVTYATTWTNTAGKVFELEPHVYKYRPANITQGGAGDVDWPIYRYAEVLLFYAEALNELGRTGEAVQYLNRIRARARNADGEPRAQPADYDGPMSQAAVREAILMERSWELAHEAKRWFDLLRRGETYFLEQIAAHDPQATDLEPSDMLWPIPPEEVDLNQLLTQNPGY